MCPSGRGGGVGESGSEGVHDGLDVVPVGIANEHPVVTGVGFRPVPGIVQDLRPTAGLRQARAQAAVTVVSMRSTGVATVRHCSK